MGIVVKLDEDRYYSLVIGYSDHKTGWVNSQFDGLKNRHGGTVSDARPQNDTTILKLTRKGNSLESKFGINDGQTWFTVPTPSALAKEKVPGSVAVGVLVSHNTNKGFEARFEDYEIKILKK